MLLVVYVTNHGRPIQLVELATLSEGIVYSLNSLMSKQLRSLLLGDCEIQHGGCSQKCYVVEDCQISVHVCHLK